MSSDNIRTKPVIIATRKSPLALKQSEMVSEHLTRASTEFQCTLLKMVTTGDKKLQWSLEKEGGKGLFTKELEDALLNKSADIAVHSAKDLPTEMPDGLAIAGFLSREIANDVLILRNGVKIPKVIATSSPRRRSQLQVLYPDVKWTTIRGNVHTRLQKIADGEADATVLAAAGLKRLGIEQFEGVHFKNLSEEEVIPATGQAAIAIQCREEEVSLYSPFLDESTGHAVFTERLCLSLMGGGCHSAMAAYYKNGIINIYHDDTGAWSITLSTKEDKREQIINALRDKQLI